MGKLDELEAALTPARRRYVYRAASAVLLILVVHGVATADDAASYLQSLALLLGLAPTELAARNVR